MPPHPPPLQPANVVPVGAVAVSVTVLPVGNEAVHVFPQLIPDGLLVTVPAAAPDPALLTLSVAGTALKAAVTDRFALMTTTQVEVPLHPLPLHPPKLDPAVGAAVNVTVVPLVNVAIHVAPQLIPAGLLVTVPSPAPLLLTVRVN